MKKLLLSLLLITFVLYGCGTKEISKKRVIGPVITDEEPLEDRTKPVITITENIISINLNQEIDLLEGVRATDNVDGDLTSQISVNYGEYNNTRIGEYIIFYRVTDSSGNTGVATRKIIVANNFNPSEVVLSYHDYQVTKGDIYNKLINEQGTSALLTIVYRDLLSPYRNKIDYDYLYRLASYYIKNDYGQFAQMGYIQKESESEAEFVNRIIKLFETQELFKVYGVEEYKKVINTSEFNQFKDSYQFDQCAIVLEFNSRQEAESSITTFNSLSGDALINKFKELWDLQKDQQIYRDINSSIRSKNITPYIDTINPCDYQRATPIQMYGSTFNSLIINEVNLNDYNRTPFTYEGNYLIIYKLSDRPNTDQIDQVKLDEDLLNLFAHNNYFRAGITPEKLLEKANFKVYDQGLVNQINYKFYGNTHPNSNVVATYNNKTITKEDLYQEFKKVNFVSREMDKLTSVLLEHVTGLALSEAEINAKIAPLKKQYELNSSKYYTWEEYLKIYYNVNNETELINQLKPQLLGEKYILGNDSFVGVDPINLEEGINKWYNIRVTRVTYSNNEIIQRQLLEGVSVGEEAYVLLDGAPFIGLNHLTPSERINQIKRIKINDPYFTLSSEFPNYVQVYDTPFHEEFLQLSKEELGSYFTTEYNNRVHLYLIYQNYEKPVKPDNYDQYSDAELEAMEQTAENFALKEYYLFVTSIKNKLIPQKLTQENVQKHMAKLRSETTVTFYDIELKELYDAYNYYIMNKKEFN